MATEIRRLVFTNAETTKALRTYGKKYDMVFPEGTVIRSRFAGNAEYEFDTMKQFKSPLHGDYNVEGNPRAVIVTFFDEKTFEQKYFNLTADFVSAALIEFCIENKIMMPKDAKKALDITEFNMCLDINFETQTSGASPLAIED